MTGQVAQTGASQRPFPVVAVTCDADDTDLKLCQELVQALSETVPSYIYRINPDPVPAEAFALTLDLSVPGQARLRWRATQAGDPVDRAGLPDTALARRLVTASPDLTHALREAL